jgi:ribonucleoside-diphosphate reductase alpha chain
MPEAAIAKVASTGYLRGHLKPMSLVHGGVRGGAAPKMLAEDDDFHEEMFQADNDRHAEAVDLSEIRAGVEASVEASMAGPAAIAAQVASIEAALTRVTAQDSRAARVAEARMKGFEGDSCGACGNFTLVRNGTCLKCNTCGSTSGCS